MAVGLRQVRVLVVDDDQEAWLNLRDMLKGIAEFECIPDWAPDFEAGAQRFDKNAADICLLDYHLAEHDGVALLKHAIRIGARFPILFVSDAEGVDAVVTTMQAGASNYLLRKNLS